MKTLLTQLLSGDTLTARSAQPSRHCWLRGAITFVLALAAIFAAPSVEAACSNPLLLRTAPIGGGSAATAPQGVGAAAPDAPAAAAIICKNPTVTLSSPGNGSTVYGVPATLTLSATAFSPLGVVTKVEFYNGTSLIGTVTGNDLGTYAMTWAGVAAGSYSITARAYDCCGGAVGIGVGYSAAAAVTVSAQQANDAQFLSQSVPTLMNAGQPYAVTLSFKNVGLNSWPAGSAYRLGSQNPQDNALWTGSNRVALAQTVAPGGTATFSFNVSAPATRGSYNFQWQMLQEGVAWFGGASTNVVVNVNAPPVVNLTVPGNNRYAPATLTLTATASDPESNPITRVEFYNGAALLAADDVGPSYVFNWLNVPAGTYSLTAKATDSNGAVGSSVPVNVTIQPMATPVLPTGQVTETRTSLFDYDATTGVLNKEVIEPNDANACLVTVYTHDSYGNVASKTTRNCNGTGPSLTGALAEGPAPAAGADAIFATRTGSTVYDGRGQFPVTVSNALNQRETHAYDARFGTRTSLTGPNGLPTTWAYDDFGRNVQEKRADGTSTTVGYPSAAGAAGAPCTWFGQWTYYQTTICYQVATYSYDSAGTQIGQPVVAYFDQANRKLFTSRINFAGTDWIDEGLTTYDALGRVDKTYRPYERGSWSAKNSVLYAQRQYDVLGRVTAEYDAYISTSQPIKTMAYSGLVGTTTVDPVTQAPQTIVTTKNVAGQTAEVEDAAGGRIRYAYDANGNLVGTDTNGIVTTLTYDKRGRKTGMVDADMGAWSYAYNALGELVKQVDAKSQSTTMTYDLLGRMTRRVEFSFDSKWEYDTNRTECASTAANNKAVGKLTAAFTMKGDGVTADTTRIHCYDNFGRASRELTTYVVGTTYTTKTTYDSAGRVDTSTYPAGPSNPSGFQVRTTYNAAGYAAQLVRVATGAVLWQATAMDAFGHVTSETLGNGLVTQRSYDDRGRPSLISTGTPGTVNTANAIQYNGAGYNAIDQVINRNWVNAGVVISESYTYDALNQLTSVTNPGNAAANKAFVYDVSGNILTKDGACTNGRGVANCQYLYTPGTHRLASITGTVQGISGIAGIAGVTNPQFLYDANGNLTAGAGLTITWTGFNMPQNIVRGTVGGVNKADWFNYGPEHQRIKQIATLAASTGTLTTWYLPGYERELNSDTGATEHKYYLSAGGRSLGVFVDRSTAAAPAGTPNDLRYFHQDQLGSVVAVTNASGGVIERLSYDAFGKRRNPDGSDSATTLLPQNDRGYTGHEMLDTVGLVHMNGRVYDPTLGRFLSADPFIQAPAATLSYHRYAYVMNNPLVLTDPSGYSWLSKTWKKLWRNEVFRVGLAIGIGMATGGWAAGVYENYAAAMILEGATPVAIGGSVSLTSGVIAGASGGFAGTLVATGGDVKAAAQSGLTGGIFGGVGVAFDGGGFANYAGHGVAGCVSAALGGGDCARGAVAQVFSKFVTVETRGMGLDRYTRSVIATVAGGAASVMTGGKFSDGARTAAMGYLFNEAKSQSEVNQSGEGVGEVSNASKAEMGVALRVQEIESMGGTVLGRNVTLVTQSGVEFQSDVVWRDRFGGFHFDEVKFGPETKLTVPQRNGLTEAIEGKFTVTGENAVRAGLTPGAPRGGLPANRIMGFELRVFGGPYFGFGERAARQWERMMRSMKVGGPD